jgi:hypothetical protein
LISSSPLGPFSVSHRSPDSGSKHRPNEFRIPSANVGLSRSQRVVRGDRPVGVQAEDAAADAVRILRAAPVVTVAHRDVQLAVGSEREIAAVVPAGRGRQQIEQRLGLGAAVALGSDPHEVVHGVGTRVVRVDPRLVGERRVDGHAEQPSLVHGHLDRQRRERPFEDLAVADDADLAAVLVGHEHRAVGVKATFTAKPKPVDLAFEPLLRSRDRRARSRR